MSGSLIDGSFQYRLHINTVELAGYETARVITSPLTEPMEKMPRIVGKRAHPLCGYIEQMVFMHGTVSKAPPQQ